MNKKCPGFGCCIIERRSSKNLVGLVTFVVVYTIAGGAMFKISEAPKEMLLRQELRDLYTKFMLENACISGKLEFNLKG